MENSLYNLINLSQIAPGFLLAAFIAILSYRFRALTKSGAIGMMIIGTIIFGLGGVLFAVPLIVFFITSTLLSFIKSVHKEEALAVIGKSGPRDIFQVFANGGIATLTLIIFAITNNAIWYIVFLTSIAEAAADTWATEIGTLSRHKPVLITNFKTVEPGRSGGISLPGTAASLIGSAVVILSGYLVDFVTGGSIEYANSVWIMAVLAGWTGAIFDSVLGAAVQVQYKCHICNQITEKKRHCGRETSFYSGYQIADNDFVNFTSTLFAGLLLLAIMTIFYI
ncbi:MAG TPA: DUF92 domain-containing protein [candidate division Zixibacteria bacterium]|nr:DUF92 domain-containing protein [candidate division Zixibacteria bacterium]